MGLPIAINAYLDNLCILHDLFLKPLRVTRYHAPLRGSPAGSGPDPSPEEGDAGDGEDVDPLAALALAASEDLVAQMPRYATPNIASTLATYSNNEQEFILRTFAGHNYDMLRHLPNGIREQQVR